jgi:CRISPR-associated protein Csm5
MNYRLTVLTPMLVGDGHKLSPIDYMVWKDQVNVLDQKRIFKLLAKGPRLEGYLSQLRKAEKLDFASWGGFAQNFAGRRIPFEHASSTAFWNQARPEHLHIPTFCSGHAGAYLPASAIKGALRTSFAFTRWNAGVVREIASRATADRGPRRPGESAEAMTLGSAASDPMRSVMLADSEPVPLSVFRVYLIRVATLEERNNNVTLAWKQAPRGNAPGNKPELSTPAFAEMAVPGTAFTGSWKTREFLKHPEVAKSLHRRDGFGMDKLLQAANEHASQLLEIHLQYAGRTGLERLRSNLEQLRAKLNEASGRDDACVLNLGWAGGFLSKTSFLDTSNEDYRRLLSRFPFYERAIRSGIPFPKTRRVVFEQDQPSTLPGWVLFEVG